MNEIPKGLKRTFLAHLVLAGVPGLLFLAIPQVWETISGATIAEPFMYRLFGAALVGFAVSSWQAYKSATWEKVQLVVELEVVWTVLASVVLLLGLLQGAFPAIVWVNFAFFGLFAVAFSTFYAQRKEEPNSSKPSKKKSIKA